MAPRGQRVNGSKRKWLQAHPLHANEHPRRLTLPAASERHVSAARACAAVGAGSTHAGGAYASQMVSAQSNTGAPCGTTAVPAPRAPRPAGERAARHARAVRGGAAPSRPGITSSKFRCTSAHVLSAPAAASSTSPERLHGTSSPACRPPARPPAPRVTAHRARRGRFGAGWGVTCRGESTGIGSANWTTGGGSGGQHPHPRPVPPALPAPGSLRPAPAPGASVRGSTPLQHHRDAFSAPAGGSEPHAPRPRVARLPRGSSPPVGSPARTSGFERESPCPGVSALQHVRSMSTAFRQPEIDGPSCWGLAPALGGSRKPSRPAPVAPGPSSVTSCWDDDNEENDSGYDARSRRATAHEDMRMMHGPGCALPRL